MTCIELELTNSDIDVLTKRAKKETFDERFIFCFILLFFIPCSWNLIYFVVSGALNYNSIFGFLFLLFFSSVLGVLTYVTNPKNKNESKFSRAIIQNKKSIGQLTLSRKEIKKYDDSKDEYLFYFDLPNFTNLENSIVDDYCYNKSKIGDIVEVEFIPNFNFFLKAKCNSINMLTQYSV